MFLSMVALTAQDCFAPNRTPRVFKITSVGEGTGEGRAVGVETRVRV